jgi:hypothetical protein
MPLDSAKYHCCLDNLYSNSDGICVQLAIFIPLSLMFALYFWLTKEKPETLKIMGEKYLTLQGLPW